jgi:hypothetical protein
VVVTDDRGRFVPGLTQKDFQVSEDGVAQKISAFSDERTPLELVTAIDVSSSVTEALPGMKTAATRFLGGLEPTDQSTVLGFNESIYHAGATIDRSSSSRARESGGSGRGVVPHSTMPSFTPSTSWTVRPAAVRSCSSLMARIRTATRRWQPRSPRSKPATR